jgi:hypothetical protein
VNSSEKNRLVTQLEDSEFPEFLFNPIGNNYENDPYWINAYELDPEMKPIVQLKRKYKDYFKYREAMKIYNDYMDSLAEVHGGERVVKNSIKNNSLDEFIPPEPKLSNVRGNKFLKKFSILPSKPLFTYDAEETKGIDDKMFPVNASDVAGTFEFREGEKTDKHTRQQIEKCVRKMTARNRINSLYKSSAAQSMISKDYVLDIYKTNEESKYNKIGKFKNMSLTQSIKEQEKLDAMPDWMLEEMEQMGKIEYMTGSTQRYKKYEDEENKEIIREFHTYGIDVFNAYSGAMDRKEIKMALGDEAATDTRYMTKKERKKWKKNKKQMINELNARMDQESALTRILTKNQLPLGDDDSLDMTYDALIKHRGKKKFDD